MKPIVEKMLANTKKTTFPLQMTSMTDMFTVLLLFLLKSYSSSSTTITPMKGLNLPSTSSQVEAINALKVIVATDGIYVDEKRVVEFKDGKIGSSDIDVNDASFIRPLYEELNKQAETARSIANEDEDAPFDGKFVMQVDKTLSYAILKKVMYTCSMAGYADLKLAAIGSN